MEKTGELQQTLIPAIIKDQTYIQQEHTVYFMFR